MKNRVKLLSVLVAVVLYGYLLITLAAESSVIVIVFIMYCGVTMLVAYTCYTRAAEHHGNQFRRKFPLNPYGMLLASFQHVFYCADDLVDEMREKIDASIRSRTGHPPIEAVHIRDIDNELESPDERKFWRSTGQNNIRGSAVSLVLHFNKSGGMQAVNWWVFVSGYINKNSLFKLIAYAPIAVPFWIGPYLRHSYNLIDKLRPVHEAFYNDLDVLTETKAVHKTVFETMIIVLEAHGVDTSDLKAQRAQIMNITIRGGRTQIGQIIQGAINRIQPQPQPQQAGVRT